MKSIGRDASGENNDAEIVMTGHVPLIRDVQPPETHGVIGNGADGLKAFGFCSLNRDSFQEIARLGLGLLSKHFRRADLPTRRNFSSSARGSS